MDKRTKITKIYNLLEHDLSDPFEYAIVLREVIDFFDFMSKQSINNSDLEILRIIAIEMDIPSLFHMIYKNVDDNNPAELSLNHLVCIMKESRYYISETILLHKYQIKFIEKVLSAQNFRLFFTAPTSFGKTMLIKEIIKISSYKNILLIFPSIALISENIMDLYTNPHYNTIREKYSIISMIDEDEKGFYTDPSPKLFLLTIERYLSLRSMANINFDFSFIDEIYKLDDFMANEDLEDLDFQSEDKKEYNLGREVAYRFGVQKIVENSRNTILAGPYLDIEDETENSFSKFLSYYQFDTIDYNMVKIVNEMNIDCKATSKSKKNSITYDDQVVLLNADSKTGKFLQLMEHLYLCGEFSLVYTSTIKLINYYSKVLIDHFDKITLDEDLEDFVSHLEDNYHDQWLLPQCLKRGFAFHHGRLPKYIQREILNLFEHKKIKILICTTTIIEGVNTVAKNMVVLNSNKGSKALNRFDALNIAGRSGRFTKHFVGRCFFLDADFENILHGEHVQLTHIDYSTKTKTSTTDLFISETKYLNEEDLKKKQEILDRVDELELQAQEVFEIMPEVDMNLKLDLIILIKQKYPTIQALNQTLCSTINKRTIERESFDYFINLYKPILEKTRINRYLYLNQDKSSYVISLKLNNYAINGLSGMIKRYIEYIGRSGPLEQQKINQIINDDLRLVSNIFRFELPRIFGLIDVINEFVYKKYNMPSLPKYLKSISDLLQYDAKTKEGKMVFEFGATKNVVDYFDGKAVTMDKYESRQCGEIKAILFDYQK